tara:strand:- start:763 stop:1047 length:285 start_codon:yes stop_codon:yes gene_type:complete
MTTPPIKKNGFTKMRLSIPNSMTQMWKWFTKADKNFIQKVVYWRLLSVFVVSITVYANLHWLDKTSDLVVLLVFTLTPAHYFFERFWDYYERTK